MGTYNEQAVALKVIRIFDGDATSTLKVRVLLFTPDLSLLKMVCYRNLWKKFRSGAASATRMFLFDDILVIVMNKNERNNGHLLHL